jgi:hypothetical protein
MEMICSNPYILTTKQDKRTGQRIELKEPLTIPCEKCDLCLAARAKKWAEQCMLEAKLTNLQTHCNLFITLTYSDAFLPENNSLCKNDLSEYLEKIHNLNISKNQKIKFFAAGEYGDITHRPHYHLILFNVPQTWITKTWRETGKAYFSVLVPELISIWNKGEIADINLLNRGYTSDDNARYAIKYASQYHQKGGINYYNFTEKIKVNDGRWLDVNQPENTPNWIEVVKVQIKGNKAEWIDNLGRVRPFRRMSVELGLSVAMRLKSVSEPVMLSSDGLLYKRRSMGDIIGGSSPTNHAVYNVPMPKLSFADKSRYYYGFEDGYGKRFTTPEHNDKWISSDRVTANKYYRQIGINKKIEFYKTLEKEYTAPATKEKTPKNYVFNFAGGKAPTLKERFISFVFKILATAIATGIISVGSKAWKHYFHVEESIQRVQIINPEFKITNMLDVKGQLMISTTVGSLANPVNVKLPQGVCLVPASKIQGSGSIEK